MGAKSNFKKISKKKFKIAYKPYLNVTKIIFFFNKLSTKVLKDYKFTLNNKYSLINKHRAPVAQLDRALGYGPGGSGFKS